MRYFGFFFLLFSGYIKAQVCLSPPVIFPTGSQPQTISYADFNSDGKPDLVTPDYAIQFVSVLLGNGAGSFSSFTNFPSGGDYPQYVSCNDFNGDGKIDIAVSNTGTNIVSVLLGTGTGSFGLPISKSLGGLGVGLEGITSGDFNSDGKQDIATANYLAGNVSILLGVGTGSLLNPVNYSCGSSPMSITTTYINGDSNLDLAVANMSGSVTVLLGNGTGGFSLYSGFSTGVNPYCITSADFNNDGKKDLATASTSGNISVLLGLGTGSFFPSVNYNIGVSSQNLCSDDINSDGKMDLIATASNSIAILLGIGTGSFNTPALYNGGGYATGILTADFNSDGKIDVAANNYSADNISVFLNCALSLSVSDKELFNGLQMFPNPTNNFINVLAEENEFRNSEIIIANYLGQEVLKEPFANPIDVSKLANGIYTLKIVTKDSQNYYSKFIKE